MSQKPPVKPTKQGRKTTRTKQTPKKGVTAKGKLKLVKSGRRQPRPKRPSLPTPVTPKPQRPALPPPIMSVEFGTKSPQPATPATKETMAAPSANHSARAELKGKEDESDDLTTHDPD